MKLPISLDRDSPITNAIMGALVSGGDCMKLARQLVSSVDEETEEKQESETEIQ